MFKIKNIWYGLFICICCLYVSCSTEPVLDVKTYSPKLVIDGHIEQGGFASVILTYSTSYFSDIDSLKIRKLVATTAKVTVTDGVNEEVLTLKHDNRYFPPYIYEGTSLVGETGKSYKLIVEHRGETYTATTTIPPAVKFDEVWFELAKDKDSLGYIYGELTDDPNTDNYYRIFTQRISKDTKFIPVYLSAVGDQYFNGKDFVFPILRGPESFTDVIDDLYFQRGDTIRLKLCTMDKAHFDFWRTLERELYVVGNPFSSSGNQILSNIDGKKALGVWGGYGVTYYRIITE